MTAPVSSAAAKRVPWRLFYLLPAMGLVLAGCTELLLTDAERLEESATASLAVGEDDYARGKRELAAGRLGLAVLHFRAALAQAPDSVEALNGLGAAFDLLGRYDLSARAYGRALAIDPRAVGTLNNLGYSYLLQGRHELAVAYLRDAAARAGGDARIMENRRMAETALARAGGPAPRNAVVAAPPGRDAGAPFKPRIVRAGKGLRHLVTKPPPAANLGLAARSPRPDPPLPAFLAAPMALDDTWDRRPALGARDRP